MHLCIKELTPPIGGSFFKVFCKKSVRNVREGEGGGDLSKVTAGASTPFRSQQTGRSRSDKLTPAAAGDKHLGISVIPVAATNGAQTPFSYTTVPSKALLPPRGGLT